MASLGSRIQQSRNEHTALRVGKRWKSLATEEQDEAGQDPLPSGASRAQRVDSQTRAAIERFIDERVQAETYDLQFEGERVYLKPRAVPYIDGDREMRERREAERVLMKATRRSHVHSSSQRADPVQLGFLEAIVYGNGPKSRLSRARSEHRSHQEQASSRRQLPRTASARSSWSAHSSQSHRSLASTESDQAAAGPSLADLVSQRKSVRILDLSRRSQLAAVAEESTGAASSVESGAGPSRSPAEGWENALSVADALATLPSRSEVLERLSTPTPQQVRRMDEARERRRRREGEEATRRRREQRPPLPRSRSRPGTSAAPAGGVATRPMTSAGAIGHPGRGSHGASAPLLPPLRVLGAEEGGAATTAQQHQQQQGHGSSGAMPRAASAASLRGSGPSSASSAPAPGSPPSSAPGSGKRGALPELLHLPVSAVDERLPLQGHTDVLVAKAVAYLEAGEPQWALDQCQAALSHDHRHFGARFQRGVAHFHLGAFDAAVRDFSAALRAPTAARHRLQYLHYNRALAHAQAGDFEAALRDLGAALRLDPSCKRFWDARGLVHRRTLQFRAARDDYATLRSLARRDPGDAMAARVLEAERRFQLDEDAEGDPRLHGSLLGDPEAEFRKALSAQPQRRTEAQCQLLAQECKMHSNFFLRFTDDVLEEMWTRLALERFDAGQRVFDAESEGDKFYILFSGTVSVRVPLSADDAEGSNARAFAARHERDEVEVSTLSRGDTFGELAIVQGGRRQASIVATERVELVSLAAEDYRSTVKLQEDRLLSSKAEFLRRAMLFEPLGAARIEKIARIARTRLFERGETIVAQGDKLTKLFLVRKGLVRVRRVVTEQEPPYSQVRVNVCTLTPHDFFGEAVSQATFTCDTKVECLELHQRQMEPNWMTEEMYAWIAQLGVRYPADAKLLQLALDRERWERRQAKIVRRMERDRRAASKAVLRDGAAQYMVPVKHRAKWR